MLDFEKAKRESFEEGRAEGKEEGKEEGIEIGIDRGVIRSACNLINSLGLREHPMNEVVNTLKSMLGCSEDIAIKAYNQLNQ